MSKSNDSIQRTLLVALVLCLVCAVVVAASAVALKPMQLINQELDRRSNILIAAGLITAKEANKERVEQEFAKIQIKVVDLRSGEYVEGIDADQYNQVAAAKDSATSFQLAKPALGSNRLENYGLVYLVGDISQPEKIILPIRGPGLWSTLYGFLALEGDGNTIAGLGFYEHGETPGLGGEVDNPNWKAQWPGKQAFGDNNKPALGLAKQPDGIHEVDTLAGSTLTSRGVTNLLQFWVSDQAYGAFLAKFRNGGA